MARIQNRFTSYPCLLLGFLIFVVGNTQLSWGDCTPNQVLQVGQDCCAKTDDATITCPGGIRKAHQFPGCQLDNTSSGTKIECEPDPTQQSPANGGLPAPNVAVNGGGSGPSGSSSTTPSVVTPAANVSIPNQNQGQNPNPTGTHSPSSSEANLQRNGNYSGVQGIVGNGGECDISGKIDGQYECDSTRSAINRGFLMTQMSAAAGALSTTISGNNNYNTAASENTQAAMQRAAAETTRTAATASGAAALVNMAAGVDTLVRGQRHETYRKKFQSTTGGALQMEAVDADGKNAASSDTTAAGVAGHISSKDDVTQKIVTKFDLNIDKPWETKAVTTVNGFGPGAGTQQAARAQEIADRKLADERNFRDAKSRTNIIGSRAAGEQLRIANEAKGAALMSIMTAAGQAANWYANKKQADAMEAAADALEKSQTAGGGNLLAGANLDMGAGTALGASGAGVAIMGNGNPNAQPSMSADAGSASPAPDFGSGFNPNPWPSSAADGPQAGKFNEGAPSSGGGGGGGGLAEGAGTAADNSKTDEPQPKMVNNNEKTGNYESNGTFGSTGGGGFGKGAEGGENLGSLLEKMMKKDEQNQKNPTTNVQFGVAGPDSTQPMSVLGRDADIFKRIHDTYQTKNRQGIVGG